MFKPWLGSNFTNYREFLEKTDRILGCKLSEVMTDGMNELLDKSENAQPAIMAMSVMILRLLEREFGFKTKQTVDVTLSHSLEVYAALVAPGCLDFPFALKMVRRCGEIMDKCTRVGRRR